MNGPTLYIDAYFQNNERFFESLRDYLDSKDIDSIDTKTFFNIALFNKIQSDKCRAGYKNNGYFDFYDDNITDLKDNIKNFSKKVSDLEFQKNVEITEFYGKTRYGLKGICDARSTVNNEIYEFKTSQREGVPNDWKNQILGYNLVSEYHGKHLNIVNFMSGVMYKWKLPDDFDSEEKSKIFTNAKFPKKIIPKLTKS